MEGGFAMDYNYPKSRNTSINQSDSSSLPSFPICPLGQSQSEVRLGHLSAHFGVADILSRISSMSFYEVSSHHNEALHSTSSTRSFFLSSDSAPILKKYAKGVRRFHQSGANIELHRCKISGEKFP